MGACCRRHALLSSRHVWPFCQYSAGSPWTTLQHEELTDHVQSCDSMVATIAVMHKIFLQPHFIVKVNAEAPTLH